MTRFYTKDVIKEMCDLLVKENVCKNVFSNHRPSSISPSMNEFVVVSVPLTQYNLGVCQKLNGRFEIYVKNKATGVEDTVKLDRISNKIAALFPYVSQDRRASWTEPKLYIKGIDGLEYSVWLVNSTVTVNTTDKSKV